MKHRDTTAGRVASFLLGCAVWFASGNILAEEATVAVATNFLRPMQTIEDAFEIETGHELVIVSGSTGQLYAQIVNGAPFDVFLAADEERPQRLGESALGLPDSRFCYASGRLVLYSAIPELLASTGLDSLATADFRWFAIAEPEVAPYGRAARQALERLGVWGALERRIVRAQNVSLTFAQLETGNAELGLVALSQVQDGKPRDYRLVPAELHDPIRQDAILLRRAVANPAALALMAWLRGADAIGVIESFGYEVTAPAGCGP